MRASDQFWGHWFARCWANIARHCTNDACALIFTDWRTIGVLEQAIGEVDGWSVTQVAVWDREAMGLGSPMRAGHELIAFARARDFKWEGRRDSGSSWSFTFTLVRKGEAYGRGLCLTHDPKVPMRWPAWGSTFAVVISAAPRRRGW